MAAASLPSHSGLFCLPPCAFAWKGPSLSLQAGRWVFGFCDFPLLQQSKCLSFPWHGGAGWLRRGSGECSVVPRFLPGMARVGTNSAAPAAGLSLCLCLSGSQSPPLGKSHQEPFWTSQLLRAIVSITCSSLLLSRCFRVCSSFSKAAKISSLYLVMYE